MKFEGVFSHTTRNNDTMDQHQQEQLRQLPGVDKILDTVRTDPFFEDVPKSVTLKAVRSAIDGIRRAITEKKETVDDVRLSPSSILAEVKLNARRLMAINLKRVVNATGIVVHTNLGRSLLSRAAVQNLNVVAENYTNLEFDLEKGHRGSRYSAVEDLLCEISGAESAMVVNNNAGAVFFVPGNPCQG